MRRGYPCTWAEVDPAVLEASERAAVRLAARMEGTGSPQQVADLARRIPGMAEVAAGDLAVRFRLEGGRPYWVFLPYDPDFPIEGGMPALRAAGRGGASISANPSIQNGRTAEAVGEAGQGKRALVLSPFEWQFAASGGKAAPVASVIASIPDYMSDRGGEVVFHANLVENGANPAQLSFDFRRVGGQVTLSDFMDWDRYQYIYLSTHGAEVCPAAGGPCHTSLMAGPAGPADLAMAATVDGIDRLASLTNLNPGLTPTESDWCVERLQDGAMDAGTEGGKPCLYDRPLDYRILLLSTDFFRARYGGGLEDVIVFLAACQSTRAGDLADVLTGDRSDVAVFGYDEVVRTDQAQSIGIRTAELVRDRLSADSIERVLNVEFEDQPFFGLVQSSGQAEPGLVPARLQAVSRGAVYGRDIVHLVDPATDQELRDSATLFLAGAPGDGRPDSADVSPALAHLGAGLADPDLYEVRVAAGGGSPSGPYAVSERRGPTTLLHPGPVALGFDAREGQRVDLTVTARLPGGGESRWTYRDVRLGGFFWSLTIGDGPYAGTYGGSDARALMQEGRIVGVNIYSGEGAEPFLMIQLGGGTDTPFVEGTAPFRRSQGAAVVLTPTQDVTGAFNRGEAVGWGSGTEGLRDGRYPPPATITITSITTGAVAGSVAGVFYRTTDPETGASGGYPELRADVRLEFRAKPLPF